MDNAGEHITGTISLAGSKVLFLKHDDCSAFGDGRGKYQFEELTGSSY
jgi:hypothetical protein